MSRRDSTKPRPLMVCRKCVQAGPRQGNSPCPMTGKGAVTCGDARAAYRSRTDDLRITRTFRLRGEIVDLVADLRERLSFSLVERDRSQTWCGLSVS